MEIGLHRKYNGGISIITASIILVFMLLIVVSLEIANIFSVVQTSKNNINHAVLAVAAVNVGNVYHGVRDAYGLANFVTEDDVQDYLISKLGMSKQGSRFIKQKSDDRFAFAFTDLKVVCDNSDDGLSFKSNFKLEVPIYFMGKYSLIYVDVYSKSTYDAKF